MKIFTTMIATGLVLILGACATTPPPEPRVDLSQYRTFALAPLPAQGPKLDSGAAARLGGVARQAIVETLVERGFQEVERSAADFIVKLHAEFSEDAFIENSEKRLLTIEFLDGKTDAALWSNQRGRSSSRTMEPEILRKSILGMLASVPPSAAGRAP